MFNLDVNYLKMFNLNKTICKPNVSVTDFANLLTQNFDNHDKFLLHLNVRNLNKNINKINELLATLPYSPHVIIISISGHESTAVLLLGTFELSNLIVIKKLFLKFFFYFYF